MDNGRGKDNFKMVQRTVIFIMDREKGEKYIFILLVVNLIQLIGEG